MEPPQGRRQGGEGKRHPQFFQTDHRHCQLQLLKDVIEKSAHCFQTVTQYAPLSKNPGYATVGPSTYYITLGRGRGVDNLLYALYGRGGCISYCYITQPDFFHRDPTSWAIHEYSENKKYGLLTDADRNVC